MSLLPRSSGPSARTSLAVGLAAAVVFASAALAQTPVGTQPTLPQPIAAPKASPVVDTIAGSHPALEVHRMPSHHAARPVRRHFARYHDRAPIDVERPALAGVVLVEPIPPRVAAPRPMVPMPAYFVDGIASAFTTPAPAVVCERRPRDRTLPDPRLYREVPLECGYDID
ncbi:hypothetical protein [Beijerinckia sp. L45]|uniref:hypothetical protein n=1 Tax=Beijerinckia sp. L45 TaxID=1641855 RepID=UPI00131B4948|nr:hypothetical protein [Beijerinckia sp. L45]